MSKTDFSHDLWNRTLKSSCNYAYLLYNHKMGDYGTQTLSENLKTNRTLTKLNIMDNDIGDLGAQYLSKALETNWTLTELNLHKNKIGTEVLKKIKQELEDNKTGRKKERLENGKLLLLSRYFQEDSVLYKEYLPLDIFKKIFKLSDVCFLCSGSK